jgi:hypothetical protein
VNVEKAAGHSTPTGQRQLSLAVPREPKPLMRHGRAIGSGVPFSPQGLARSCREFRSNPRLVDAARHSERNLMVPGTDQVSTCWARMIVSFRTTRLWCDRCDSTGWICEAHRRKPWDGPKSCGCGAAGLPCIACNKYEPGELPDVGGLRNVGPRPRTSGELPSLSK